MKTMFSMAVVALLLVACAPPESASVSQSGFGGISYFKDTRSGLCFATTSRNSLTSKSATLTNVPCTPEVENLLR